MRKFDLEKRSIRSKKRELDEEKATLEKLRAETDFEKSDFAALTIAAFITILPVVLVILFLFYILTSLFFS